MNIIIHVVCKILQSVMASDAEAELCSMLVNYQDAVPIQITLIEMNHPQPPTPVQLDSSTTVGISNEALKHNMSKAMGMQFYWIMCRINKDQLLFILNQVKITWMITPLSITPPPITL